MDYGKILCSAGEQDSAIPGIQRDRATGRGPGGVGRRGGRRTRRPRLAAKG